MARKRVLYFVITIAALWLMGSPPASMAQPGFDRMVWMGGVGLTTSPSRSAAVLHATPGALRQVFPGADAATLLARHREALAWLSTQGICARPLRGAEFETLFRSAMERHRAAFRAARLRFAFTAIWRVVSRTTPNLGPLPQQRAARAEIRRLARP